MLRSQKWEKSPFGFFKFYLRLKCIIHLKIKLILYTEDYISFRKIFLMKKILSFLMLLSFLIIGLSHNSMMVFAWDIFDWSTNNLLCCHTNQVKNDSTPQCSDSCCSEQNIDHWASTVVRTEEKVLKIWIGDIILDSCIFSVEWFTNKYFSFTASPPIFERKIKNYSYSGLIKIIKSNT